MIGAIGAKKTHNTAQKDAFIEREGVAAYGKWHLGIHSDECRDFGTIYSFPYGDFEKVMLRA